jgi:hypothetical protein
MRKLTTLAASAALASIMTVGLWSATSVTASAETVCNRWHECWHVDNHYDYPANVGIVVRPDGWHGRHYHWRHAHPGHGYYRSGVWIGL